MPRRALATYVVLVTVLALGLGASLLAGQGSLGDPELRRVFLDLRATRTAAALLVGAALAVGGVLAQGMFRNPLVSPSILGTTAGASFGGQAALLAVGLLSREGAAAAATLGADMVLPVGCFVGAAIALVVVLAFDRAQSGPMSLLLTGFVLSSLFLSMGAFLTSVAQESWDVGRAVVAFTLGGVAGVGHRHVLVALPLVAAGIVAAWLWGRSLDVLLSGDEEAASLGLDVKTTRRLLVVWMAVLTAAAVAIGGNVGFVGLIVPHALRPFVGPLHRRLVPAAALGGGAFLVLADAAGRALPIRSEIPLGVITGLVGAPVFLFLLARTLREVEHG